MKLRYNYRIYPNRRQQTELAKAFGCSRVVWNDGLGAIKNIEDGQQWPKMGDLQKQVTTDAKKTVERSWLSDVSSVVLQQSFIDLKTSLKNFFDAKKGDREGGSVGFPRFKCRHDKQSIRFTKAGFSIANSQLYLAKIGTLNVKWSRDLPSNSSSVTVTLNKAGQYHASFVVEVQPPVIPAIHSSIGIDLGIKVFAVTSHGEYVQSPGYDRLDRRIRRLSRRLAKQQKGSSRWQRTKKRIAKLHLKIANIRKDFLHKFSSKVVKENQIISLEDLNVKGMVKNRKLARAIAQQGWGEFRSMVQAKSTMYGRESVVIDRWAPTSQYCSECGYNWGKLDLSVRQLKCLNCGAEHDRDENAAVNIDQSGQGLAQDSKWTGREHKTSSDAIPVELSTRLVGVQLCLNI